MSSYDLQLASRICLKYLFSWKQKKSRHSRRFNESYTSIWIFITILQWEADEARLAKRGSMLTRIYKLKLNHGYKRLKTLLLAPRCLDVDVYCILTQLKTIEGLNQK